MFFYGQKYIIPEFKKKTGLIIFKKYMNNLKIINI